MKFPILEKIPEPSAQISDQWDEEEGLEAHFDAEDYDFLPSKEERFFE